MQIRGKRVLITGAGHGLGLAIAAAFGRSGARVVITDLQSERVEQAVADLSQFATVCGYQLDVTRPDEIVEVRSRLATEHGSPEILVNNAGVVQGGTFLEVPLERHLKTVGVNLAGVIATTHAFLPEIIASPAGHVVNIASAAAVVALPMATSYAASKWAVLGFSDSLLEELRMQGHRHVGVTTVCPAFISTGLFDGAQPARLTGWLTPDHVARRVVRAVEKGQEFVMLPWRARAMYWLCAGWPRRGYRAVCRGLGISRSMIDWRGHRPPDPQA